MKIVVKKEILEEINIKNVDDNKIYIAVINNEDNKLYKYNNVGAKYQWLSLNNSCSYYGTTYNYFKDGISYMIEKAKIYEFNDIFDLNNWLTTILN